MSKINRKHVLMNGKYKINCAFSRCIVVFMSLLMMMYIFSLYTISQNYQSGNEIFEDELMKQYSRNPSAVLRENIKNSIEENLHRIELTGDVISSGEKESIQHENDMALRASSATESQKEKNQGDQDLLKKEVHGMEKNDSEAIDKAKESQKEKDKDEQDLSKKEDKQTGEVKTHAIKATSGEKVKIEKLKLKAYIEPINQSDWEIKPLPVRHSKASELSVLEFNEVSSCKNLHEQWPIDEHKAPTNKDPFLPWIHDVFPTADGKFIQFVAQNKRRCQTGKKKAEIKKFFQPNVALFQHVPVKRITLDANNEQIENTRNNDTKGANRYRLTSHEDADEDGIETRFICRFKPSMEETLSVHNFNYDFHTLRKAYSATFTEEGFDNHMIWSSQLLFKCPVPMSLQEDIRLGNTVIDDYASLFVDLIPIRTPPRYGLPTTYLPPRLFDEKNTWNVTEEWGKHHVLPLIEDSGRWENIPICKPSLMTYPDEFEVQSKETDEVVVKQHDLEMAALNQSGGKKHDIIACTWTSATFKTRGGRTTVNDGEQRLRQWLEFNRLVGIDHVYIYDNSGSFSKESSLKSVTDLFPGYVTRISWPAKVCNNNKGNADNKGERSSQYAADASCRLRFGAHSKWLASMDTDEYLVPLEQYDSLKDILRDVDKEDINVLNFASKRSKPRLQFFNTTSPGSEEKCQSNKDCFDPIVPENTTFLEAYNCNIERPPRKTLQPAEKAIYKPEYVLQFFVHYATVTTLSARGKKEANELKERWFTRFNARSHVRFVDETKEATMLHTKAIVTKETAAWHRKLSYNGTRDSSMVGVEWPESSNDGDDLTVAIKGENYYPNCYIVPWIDNHWVPKLNTAMVHGSK